MSTKITLDLTQDLMDISNLYPTDERKEIMDYLVKRLLDGDWDYIKFKHIPSHDDLNKAYNAACELLDTNIPPSSKHLLAFAPVTRIRGGARAFLWTMSEMLRNKIIDEMSKDENLNT